MKDPAFGSAYLERWCEAYPEATVHRLDDSGHFPQEEAPEAVTLDILDAANATR